MRLKYTISLTSCHCGMHDIIEHDIDHKLCTHVHAAQFMHNSVRYNCLKPIWNCMVCMGDNDMCRPCQRINVNFVHTVLTFLFIQEGCF